MPKKSDVTDEEMREFHRDMADQLRRQRLREIIAPVLRVAGISSKQNLPKT